MLGTLLKKELAGLGNSVMNSGKRSSGNLKKRTVGMKILIGLALIYIVGMMGVMFYMMADSLCEPFVEIGIDWAYFAVMGIMSLTFCIIGGAMSSYSTIYKAKDNEFLLSMPIRPSLILSTRVLICYAIDFVLNLIIMSVAFIVYESYFSLTGPMVAGWIINVFFFPLLGLVLSLLLGWLVALVTSKVPPEKKSYVSLVFVLLFVGAYIFLYTKMIDIMDIIVSEKDSVAGFLEKYIKPVFWMGKASTGDFNSMIFLVLVSAAAFAIVYMLLSTTFIKVVTTAKGRKNKVKYKEEDLKTSDVKGALLSREFVHFRRNTTIMVNFGLGLILFVIMGIAAIIMNGKISGFIENLGAGANDAAILLGNMAVLYILAMCPITAPSLSLEANTLWILKSLPVSTKDIYTAKLKEHLFLTVPSSMIATIGVIVAIKPSPVLAVLSVVCILVFNFFMATWGLRLNINRPSFDWKNEAAAVKRSVPVMILTFGTMGIILTLFILYVFFGSIIGPSIFLGIICAVIALFTLLNYRWIFNKGIEIFEKF